MSLIKIPKEEKTKYMWSVDGNRYGTPYDSTKCYGFSDENLVKDGWSEVLAVNGSLFYYFENSCYACGLEKSRGENNQDVSMSCVSKYNNCMAIACDSETGELIFGKQKWIISNVLDSCYGAITGLGVMLAGKVRTDLHDGFESQWNSKARRNLIGEDANGNFMSLIIDEEVSGAEMCSIAVSNGFYNCLCLDGGGSIFRRIYGNTYDFKTDRKIKNALLLYKKEDKPIDWEEKYKELSEDYLELSERFAELKETTTDYLISCKNSTDESIDSILKIIEEI